MPLLASSQTLSTEEYCSVPCRTLKNALLVKNERDMLVNQVGVMRDSISILSDIVLTQNDLIINRDSVIIAYQTNETRYVEMLGNKDSIVELKNKQIKKEKTKALAGWAVAVVNGALLVLKLL
jgi:hypothetical protein